MIALDVLSLAAMDPLSHVLPHPLLHDGPAWLSNHMLMATVAALLVVAVFSWMTGKLRPRGSDVESYIVRGRVAQIFEVLLVFLREEMARPALGKLTDKYIGFIWTVFFFILFSNLLGMIPLGEIGGLIHPSLAHIGGTATANLAVTAVLAGIALFMIFFTGIREQGPKYFAHFSPVPLWPFMKDSSPALLPVAVLLILLEIVGAFVKPFALCMRLFANMLAGHMVLAALIGLIFVAAEGLGSMAYGISIPVIGGALAISLLELFVSFLQAYIFTFLTVLFIAQGAVHHHDEHHGEEPDEADPASLSHGHADADGPKVGIPGDSMTAGITH